jgi:hypothetical protein
MCCLLTRICCCCRSRADYGRKALTGERRREGEQTKVLLLVFAEHQGQVGAAFLSWDLLLPLPAVGKALGGGMG